ncbi:hypothetical protein, partial [Thiolapillus sp.]|uniref:hypothetical protein n=1 Tax=Thiolapillus sp. TaxID=2017437 RepID=UPI0025FB2719
MPASSSAANAVFAAGSVTPAVAAAAAMALLLIKSRLVKLTDYLLVKIIPTVVVNQGCTHYTFE